MTAEQEVDQTKAITLQKVGDLCERQLLNLFQQLLDRADTVFFDLAHVASPREQQGLFDSMRVIRLQRQQLEQEFKHQLHIIMSRMPKIGSDDLSIKKDSELSLMDDDDLTDNIAFDAMVNQTLIRYENHLHHLLSWYQYAYGSYSIQLDWLPVHPVHLGEAVRQSFKQLKLSARVMTVMYQLFEREVLSNLGGVIIAATNLFNDAENVGKKSVTAQTDTPPGLRQLSDEEQQQVNDYLNDLYRDAEKDEQTHAPSINTEQLITGIGRIQQQTEATSSAQVLVLGDVLSNVINAGREKLGLLNAELIKLVCEMFHGVLSAKSLADEFRLPISRLQLPLLKIALKDREIFSDREHPARQIVNEIAHAGLGFDPARRGNDVILSKVNAIVTEVVAAPFADSAAFEKWLTDFQLCVREEYRRSVILERRVNETEEGKARTEAARRAAEQVLKPLLFGKKVSDEMRLLLDEVWRRLLQLEHVRAHGTSDAFRHYQVTAELLLQSVDRNVLGQGINRTEMTEPVRQELREGFDAMGLPAVEITQWLNRVQHEHEKLILLDQVEQRNAATRARVRAQQEQLSGEENLAVATAIPDSVAEDVAAVINDNAVETAASHLQASVGDEFLQNDIDIKAVEQRGIADEIWQLVDGLPVPSWLLKQHEDGSGLRCKLAAKIPSIGRYIFVNRSGMKVLDMQREDVAAAFADGTMSMIDDCALFDRALSDVISNLRHLKEREERGSNTLRI